VGAANIFAAGIGWLLVGQAREVLLHVARLVWQGGSDMPVVRQRARPALAAAALRLLLAAAKAQAAANPDGDGLWHAGCACGGLQA
jgi:hypothetical protein